MLRTLIVDDEVLARDLVRSLLRRESDVEVVGECRSGEEALEAVRSLQPDLVLLDVQMPGLSGIELGERIAAHPRPHVVYVTAYDRYAIQAFEVRALDYLLKPLQADRFAAAVQRAREAQAQRGPNDRMGRLEVRQGRKRYRVSWKDIEWVESANQYVRIHTRDRVHLVSRSLRELEKLLPPDRFVRIHRSALVNVECVDEVARLDNGTHRVVLRGGQRLTLSRSRRAALGRLLPGG